MREFASAFARTLQLSADSEDQIARTVPALLSPAANESLAQAVCDLETRSTRRYERVAAVLADLSLHLDGQSCWATTALLREALAVETLTTVAPTPAPTACAGVLVALVRLQASRYELLANWAAAAALDSAARAFGRSLSEHLIHADALAAIALYPQPSSSAVAPPLHLLAHVH